LPIKKTPGTLHHFTLKYARPKDRGIATMNSLGQNQAKTRISGAFPNDFFLAELTLLHIENQYLVANSLSDLQYLLDYQDIEIKRKRNFHLL